MDLTRIDFAVERGFTSLPKKVIWKLPVSSGAKLALIALCEMAHGVTGRCSMYLDTLGEMLGKARSTVSGYIKELRELGVLQVTQLLRKGFHDRCEFTVAFYARFREQLRLGGLTDHTYTGEEMPPPPQQISEHGVQHFECKRNKKDSNNTTYAPDPPTDTSVTEQDDPTVDQVVGDLLREWQRTSRGLSWSQPVPASKDLVQRTQRYLSQHSDTSVTAKVPALPDIEIWVRETWSGLGLGTTHEQVSEHAQVLRSVAKRTDLHRLLKHLRKSLRQSWNPNWSRPSTQDQFRRFAEASLNELPATPAVKHAVLGSFLKRASAVLE